MTAADLAALERLLATVMRPGDVWQYGCGGGYGIVAYDGNDIRCQIAIAGAGAGAGDGYDYGQSPAADLAIAAVNALPELIAAARERDAMRVHYDAAAPELEDDVDSDAATISALRAEAERMRAVVEAARALVSWDWLWALPDGQIGDDARTDAGHLEVALDALDAAKDGE